MTQSPSGVTLLAEFSSWKQHEMIIRALFIALLPILLLSTGCASSCDELAEVTCREAGVDSEECKNAKERASQASAPEKESCDTALDLVKSLEKQSS